MDKPLVSIITVCYNAETDIEETILSVIKQDYVNLEYIIIDGGSIDNTLSIVQKYKSSIQTIVSEPDNGIFDAMNKGLNYVTGEWVNFMNAGDRFCNDNIVSNIFSQKFSDKVGFIFGESITDSGKMHFTPFVHAKKKYCAMGICHQAIFARSSLAKVIKFPLQFKASADYFMIHEIYVRGYEYVEFKMPVCYYKGGGFSEQNLIMYDDVAKITHSEYSFEYIWIKIYLGGILTIKKVMKHFFRNRPI